MKKIIISLFLLSVTLPLFAATVGGPVDMSTPEESMHLKNQSINNALDIYEYNMNIKSSIDLEIIDERKLASVPPDTSNVKLDGGAMMVKISDNFSDIVEPYIKIGSANFKVKWKQHDNDVTVESTGFTWGAGAKVKIWEFKDSGVKLNLDIQYRDSDLDVDTVEMNGSTALADAASKKLEIKEWQESLLVSKKFILPLGAKDLYMVPYTGLTFSNIRVDAHFTQTATGGLYSTYNASDKKPLGVVIGCDIIPSLLDWYLWSVELRLLNETAFSLGGTIRF